MLFFNLKTFYSIALTALISTKSEKNEIHKARQGVNHFRPCLFRNSILYNTLFKSSFQSSNQVLERLSLRSFQKTELAVWDELPFLSLKDLERRELAIL